MKHLFLAPQQTTQLMPTTIPTPEPIRNPTPITILPNNTVVSSQSIRPLLYSHQNIMHTLLVIIIIHMDGGGKKCQQYTCESKNLILVLQILFQPIIQTQPTNVNANTNSNNTNVTAKSNTSSNAIKIAETDSIATTKKSTRKPKKPKTKKDTGNSNQSTAANIQTTSTSQIQNNMKFVQTTANNPPSGNIMSVATSQSNQTSQLPASVTTSTGKLDLANVMKLCGIMDGM